MHGAASEKNFTVIFNLHRNGCAASRLLDFITISDVFSCTYVLVY